MTFEEYLNWSRCVTSSIPELRHHGETRIATAFASIRPHVEIPVGFKRVHRCDLARLWCKTHGWDPEAASRAMVCLGVRHALQLILQCYARRGRRVTLPADVYPVYWRIASDTGVETVSVDTFPDFSLAKVLETSSRLGSAIVVLPAPLKLQGRAWTQLETDCAVDWLGQEPERRLIIDGIYGFGSPPDAAMRRLVQTGQVLHLDSLSKAWLHPQVCGIALLPEQDLGLHAEDFRNLQLPQQQLFLAQQLLSDYGDFPYQLRTAITDRYSAFAKFAKNAGLAFVQDAGGYLVALPYKATMLLDEYRLLTIPATVFGSARADWSIASVLPSGA